jgi:hypothetical protein
MTPIVASLKVCRYADYHEAKVIMNSLVKNPPMKSINSVKVPVGVRVCRVRKMTTSQTRRWRRVTREDLVDEDAEDDAGHVLVQTRSYIYTQEHPADLHMLWPLGSWVLRDISVVVA